MNVKELRAILSMYPDEMPVALIESNNWRNELDLDAAVDVAIHHPGIRPEGRTEWHWECDRRRGLPEGEATLVIY